MAELKPLEKCPFCGGNGEVIITSNLSRYVACRKCYAFGPARETVEQAIDAWNKRS